MYIYIYINLKYILHTGKELKSLTCKTDILFNAIQWTEKNSIILQG